jgi:calcium-dependent protein kinase
VLEAVLYLHKHNIIHRDIKFENIMFESSNPNDWSVKLIDFGLASKYSKGKVKKERVGTPYTMAPEVIQGSYTS